MKAILHSRKSSGLGVRELDLNSGFTLGHFCDIGKVT